MCMLLGSIAVEIAIYQRSISSSPLSDTVIERSGPMNKVHSKRIKHDMYHSYLERSQGPRGLWTTMWSLRFQIIIRDKLL